MITRPQGLKLHDWADQIVTDLAPYGYVGPLQGDDWPAWAVAQIMTFPTLRGLVPDPYQFSNWIDWAERLCGAIN